MRPISIFLLIVFFSNMISPSITFANDSHLSLDQDQEKIYFNNYQRDQLIHFSSMDVEAIASEMKNGKIVNLNNQDEFIENRCVKINSENCETVQLIYSKNGIEEFLTNEISVEEMKTFLRQTMKQMKFMLRDLKRNERNQYEIDKKKLFQFISSASEDVFDDDHLIGLMIMLIILPIGVIAIALEITYLALALTADLVLIPYKFTHNIIVKIKMKRRIKAATQMFERMTNALRLCIENNEITYLEENDFQTLVTILIKNTPQTLF